MNKKTYYIERFSVIVASVVLLKTLYGKFTGTPEAVYIFTNMGLEPKGRMFFGVIEIITVFLILYGRTAFIGGLIGLFISMGALISHLFVLEGIEIEEDGGKLFIRALITFSCCIYITYARSEKFYESLGKITGRR